jgi:cell division protein FtsI (penicillin-binding protein 3)
LPSTSSTAGNHRLYILGGFLLIWFGVICVRLIYLQVFRYGDFEQRAEHQQQRSINVSAKRGVVYDRHGNELAMSVQVDSAFAVPTEIPDLPNTISLISRITGGDARMMLADCRARKTFCWVARKGDAETIERIRSMNLQGIHFQKESKRFYPKRELAAQVLGYVGTDDEGLSGIEREYNDQLQGKPGKMLISVDARKKWFGRIEKEPEAGQNVVLTIDEKIQYIAERELEQAMKDTQAIAGTVVVENPHTGEILALANRPTFNPNVKREIRNEALKNRAVSDVYEPGSTFKLVTISAAVDQGLARPDELIDCQMGSIVLFGKRIHDWHPWGVMSVSDILAHSSDVGAIKLALRMGDERMYKYIRTFGFGEQTGIELPGETRGLAKPLSRWSKISIGAIAMGQEIGITPLQLVGVISSMANDGVYVAPRIVAATAEPQGAPRLVAFHPVNEHRIISALTAAEMRQMMQGVVLRGTGRKAALEGYSAGGKTGTAQKFDPMTHKYSHTKYVASFAGFAPINNPEITVAVVIDTPQGASLMQREGGWVAAPVFHRIAQQVLEYMHVPHDMPLPANRQVWLAENKVKDSDLSESSPDRLGSLEAADTGSAEPMVPVATSTPTSGKPSAGHGPVMPAALREKEPTVVVATEKPSNEVNAAVQPEVASEKMPANGTVVLDVEQGGIEVPSFIGKSVRGAIETAQDSGLELNPVGSGIAREQSPPAGSHVSAGSRVVVKFGR